MVWFEAITYLMEVYSVSEKNIILKNNYYVHYKNISTSVWVYIYSDGGDIRCQL